MRKIISTILFLTILIVVVAGVFVLVGMGIPQIYRAVSKSTSTESMFRSVVLNPIPSSVQLLDGHMDASPGDALVWLHFKVSKEDFDRILKSKGFVKDPRIVASGVDECPWWKPQTMVNIEAYSTPEDSNASVHMMWVNGERTDVYYQYVKL